MYYVCCMWVKYIYFYIYKLLNEYLYVYIYFFVINEYKLMQKVEKILVLLNFIEIDYDSKKGYYNINYEY